AQGRRDTAEDEHAACEARAAIDERAPRKHEEQHGPEVVGVLREAATEGASASQSGTLVQPGYVRWAEEVGEVRSGVDGRMPVRDGVWSERAPQQRRPQ